MLLKIILSLLFCSFFILTLVIYQGFRNVRKDNAEKAFYDLWWKIEYSCRDHISEKYLAGEIEKLRKRTDINQGMLDKLEDKFKFKFEIDTEEFSPENML